MKKLLLFTIFMMCVIGCQTSNDNKIEKPIFAFLYDDESGSSSLLYLEDENGINREIEIDKLKYLGGVPVVYNEKYNAIYSHFDLSYINGCDSDIVETNLNNFSNKIYDWNDWGEKCSISSFTSDGDYLYASDNVNGKGNLLQINLKTGKKVQKIIDIDNPLFSTMKANNNLLFAIFESDYSDSNKLFMTDFKKTEKIISLDYKQMSINNIDIYEDNVYMNVSIMYKNNRNYLYKYDIKKNKINRIGKTNGLDVLINKGKIYSVDKEKIYIFDIKTGKNEIIKLRENDKRIEIDSKIISNDKLFIYYYESDPEEVENFMPKIYEYGPNEGCSVDFIDIYDLRNNKFIKTENPYDKKYNSQGRCFASFVGIE